MCCTSNIFYIPLLLQKVFLFILYNIYTKKNRNYYLPAKYAFHEDGVFVTTPISEETYKWEVFIRWKKLGNYYLLWVSSRNFMVIPRSALKPEDVSEFEVFLHDNIKK